MSRQFSDDELADLGNSKDPKISELAKELRRVYPILFDKRVDRARDLLGHLLSEYDSYHNHKENMAHAALVLVLALAGAILSLDHWPPLWVPSINLPPKWIAFIGFLLVWGLGHRYIRWQLRNRRAAAIVYGGALRALSEWVKRDPCVNDLEPYSKPKVQQGKTPKCLCKFIDSYILPVSRAVLHKDIPNEIYPSLIGKHIDEQEVGGTGAVKGEYLVTVGSFFALLLVLARTYLG